MVMRKIIPLLITFKLLCILCVSCTSSKKELKTARGNALGTTYSILYFDTSEASKITPSLDSIFKAVNRSLSTYIPTSDISKINKGASIKVDEMFTEVFELSSKINKASNGYFDPTVGTLVNAWGFGPTKTISNMNQHKVDSLMQYVGWQKVVLNKDGIVEKDNKHIFLDFNAIAKGYCIDRIARFMDRKGYQDYLIEVGGELVAKGIHQEKQKDWVVGIDYPGESGNSRALIALVNLKDQAMATSGNYRKFKIDSTTGKKYVHTIDPHTGYTRTSNVLSVSIIAENCAIADAWATTFMAMPLETSKQIIRKENLEAFIIYSDEKGEIEIYKTEIFEKQLVE